jgi:exodeoxyribonuclease V gamma subunit
MIEVNELFSFFRHPQRYFFRELGIRFNNHDSKSEEREPFAIGKLEGYGIYQDWIAAELNGDTLSVKKIQAQGLWPSGVVGELAFNRQQKVIAEFVERIKLKNIGERLDDLPIDIKIGSHHLVGKLSNRYENGLLLYRYADLKGKDFVAALLHHLISHQQQPQTTYLLSNDKNVKIQDLILPPEIVDGDHLLAWLEIYQRGLQQPNAFFVEAAFAYVQQARSKRATISPLDKAKDHLAHALTKEYEHELKLLCRNVTDMNEVLNDDFEQQCQNLLQPVWDALHD